MATVKMLLRTRPTINSLGSGFWLVTQWTASFPSAFNEMGGKVQAASYDFICIFAVSASSIPMTVMRRTLFDELSRSWNRQDAAPAVGWLTSTVAGPPRTPEAVAALSHGQTL